MEASFIPNKRIKLVECPRDAMQGWKSHISTEKKAVYINELLKVGFDTIDFGSFVSKKAIPQMADTADVIKKLDIGTSKTKLLAIIANERGAMDAVKYDAISYLGYPFSISETFQLRNTNSSIHDSLKTLYQVQNLCLKYSKKLVVYLSMGFGNPYGDPYSEEIVIQWINTLAPLEIGIISVADTLGMANPKQINQLISNLIGQFPDLEIGAHLHTNPFNWKEKADAIIGAGCLRIDIAMKGIGGCPMANDELVGNMDSEMLIPYLKELNLLSNIDMEAFQKCSRMAAEIFK
jgi:hydroxymethylglutaryl-CoA lyase